MPQVAFSTIAFSTYVSSAETDMNRFGSHPNHENHSQYEGPPTYDLSEARRAEVFFTFQSTIRRGPVGGGGMHRT